MAKSIPLSIIFLAFTLLLPAASAQKVEVKGFVKVTVLNKPPVVEGVRILPEALVEGVAPRCEAEVFDEEPLVSVETLLLINGEPLNREAIVKKGDLVECVVTATDSHGASAASSAWRVAEGKRSIDFLAMIKEAASQLLGFKASPQKA